ncbi:hypothetical protein NUACC26_072990 [Scytonema sp. NUACC26]
MIFLEFMPEAIALSGGNSKAQTILISYFEAEPRNMHSQVLPGNEKRKIQKNLLLF